jgi:uncharacterized protein YecE (DUF72 family)
MNAAGDQSIEKAGPGARNPAADACAILVGTSGYSYVEWVDAGFYPAGTASGKMLSFYAESFPATELNFTWYQMPRAEAIERMRQKAPPDFLFAAKLTRTLTHEIDPQQWRQQADRFRDGISPLIQSRQLLAVLLQLPPDFHRTEANRRYLASLLDRLAGLPLAVEFRHRSWAEDRVFAELERRRVTLVAVDEPAWPALFPPLALVTNPELFYIRFHGRNADGWRSGNMQKKFDYDYTEAELQEWVEEKIITMAGQAGVAFFNNHVNAQAPRNAALLTRLLRQEGLDVKGAW